MTHHSLVILLGTRFTTEKFPGSPISSRLLCSAAVGNAVSEETAGVGAGLELQAHQTSCRAPATQLRERSLHVSEDPDVIGGSTHDVCLRVCAHWLARSRLRALLDGGHEQFRVEDHFVVIDLVTFALQELTSRRLYGRSSERILTYHVPTTFKHLTYPGQANKGLG